MLLCENEIEGKDVTQERKTVTLGVSAGESSQAKSPERATERLRVAECNVRKDFPPIRPPPRPGTHEAACYPFLVYHI